MKTVKLLLMIAISCITAYSHSYKPPKKSASLLTEINFPKGKDFDSQYKKTFDDCDKVGGQCNRDPNRLKTLLRFGDKALYFDSKMALDLDGSYVGCNCGNNMGLVDQCSTSYFWETFPSDYDVTPKKDRCKFYQNQDFVDSNKIPFVVIPKKFGKHFKVNNKDVNFIGDLGVVMYKDKMIPVIVVDEGPAFRIGEGSAALFRAIGEERCKQFEGEQCVSFKNFGIDSNVLFFIFPNSKIGKEKLNKNNALELITTEALKKFEDVKNTF